MTMNANTAKPHRVGHHLLALALSCTAMVLALPAGATPGTLDAQGCHHSKKMGYHCHPERVHAAGTPGGSQESPRERDARLRRECKGQRNAGACLGYGSF